MCCGRAGMGTEWTGRKEVRCRCEAGCELPFGLHKLLDRAATAQLGEDGDDASMGTEWTGRTEVRFLVGRGGRELLLLVRNRLLHLNDFLADLLGDLLLDVDHLLCHVDHCLAQALAPSKLGQLFKDNVLVLEHTFGRVHVELIERGATVCRHTDVRRTDDRRRVIGRRLRCEWVLRLSRCSTRTQTRREECAPRVRKRGKRTQ